MAEREFHVGAIVRCRREAANGSGPRDYRIEELVGPAGGAMLYRIKCDAEPFQRVVSGRDLDPRN